MVGSTGGRLPAQRGATTIPAGVTTGDIAAFALVAVTACPPEKPVDVLLAGLVVPAGTEPRPRPTGAR
ncbi:hypothetical protein Q5530_16090 [Saccharothrix sp. BKS2]|uniref:hypothetical protein n=1 Tax=Saccharothrix sp. BKS2 TaxID=3064400 RepID=UPI0039E9BDC4